MVCETLTCRTSSSVGPPSRPARDNLSWRSLYSPLIAFPAMARPPHLTGGVRDQLPACEMVLDIVCDLFTHRRQLKHLGFDYRIVSLLGKLPILGCLVPEIVRPVHVVNPMSRGRDSERMAKRQSATAQRTTISDRPTPRRNQTAPRRWHRDTTYAEFERRQRADTRSPSTKPFSARRSTNV